MTRVVNIYKEDYDVYIGRRADGGNSPFANPYVMVHECEREKVIEQYRGYLWSNLQSGVISPNLLKPLQGKRLGCFCAPKACHGDVLARAVEYYWGENDGI